MKIGATFPPRACRLFFFFREGQPSTPSREVPARSTWRKAARLPSVLHKQNQCISGEQNFIRVRRMSRNFLYWKLWCRELGRNHDSGLVWTAVEIAWWPASMLKHAGWTPSLSVAGSGWGSLNSPSKVSRSMVYLIPLQIAHIICFLRFYDNQIV